MGRWLSRVALECAQSEAIRKHSVYIYIYIYMHTYYIINVLFVFSYLTRLCNLLQEMKMELENQNFDSEFDIFAFKPSPKHSPVGSSCSVIDQGPLSCTPHTPARTPGNPHTPSMARTPGAPHTPGTAHTPGAAATPGGIGPHSPRLPPPPPPPPPMVPEQRALKHLCYVNHFPIVSVSPGGSEEAVGYVHESNQRMLMLYGVGP